MLIHQSMSKLRDMRLSAMAAEYVRQSESPNISDLDFDERIGMMIDAEWLLRENNRIQKRLKDAKLRFDSASLADIDYRPSRKLDRAYIARLSEFVWVREAKNIILTGCTGTGKTWLACAFGAHACRIGLHAAFFRVNRLLNEMTGANESGSMSKLLLKLKRVDILILDDWGMTVFNPLESRFLLEVIEDRYNERSTIISAQLPVANWHALFEDSTVADAVLDRLVHNSHRIDLHGPSLRAATGNVNPKTAPNGEKFQNTCLPDGEKFQNTCLPDGDID